MILRTFLKSASLAMLLAMPVAIAGGQQQQQQQQQQQAQAGALAELALTASLTGSEIVPDSVTIPGRANATFTLIQATKEVCYDVTLTDLADVTEAHLHKGLSGENGPSVLDLKIRKDTTVTKACAATEEAVFADISANPANYYLLVRTTAWPQGAVRGQLAKPKEY